VWLGDGLSCGVPPQPNLLPQGEGIRGEGGPESHSTLLRAGEFRMAVLCGWWRVVGGSLQGEGGAESHSTLLRVGEFRMTVGGGFVGGCVEWLVASFHRKGDWVVLDCYIRTDCGLRPTEIRWSTFVGDRPVAIQRFGSSASD
jgi:hypothetical protein